MGGVVVLNTPNAPHPNPLPEGEGTAIRAVRKYQVNAVAQDNIFHRFNEGQLKIKVLATGMSPM